MTPLIQHKKTTPLVFVAFVFVCLALSPQVQALSPAPDGCYPGFTTAEGCDALKSLTTGSGNTALGWLSLFSNTDGSFNSGVGAGALALNNGDDNTAVGVAALLFNSTGNNNTALGAFALFNNVNAGSNTAIGDDALLNNDSTGNGIATNNTAIGTSALFNNIDAGENTAVGFHALLNNDSSEIGIAGLNTAVGAHALESNNDGAFNTAIGGGALSGNIGGNANIALGNGAGINLTSGNHNIDIDNGGEADESNTIRIGNPGIHTATYIAGIYVSAAGPSPLTVMCGNDGKLSALISSRRFKHDIKPIDKASEAILALKPVSFRYNDDPTNTPWVGLIAEDVAEVDPDLIVRDKEGKPFGVRYEAVNAMLLNEFLKEHRKVEQLEKQVEALADGLQKVSAQLEVSKAAPQTVLNNNQ